ncbi:MAG: AMP-binding protein [Synechococcaceae cyanobacterium]|nr:AMP-binding protein [Synechococcaceae cyanobacterium]
MSKPLQLLECTGDPPGCAADLERLWQEGAGVALVAPQERSWLEAQLPAEGLVLDEAAIVLGSGGSSGGRRWCVQPLSHLQASARACGTWLQAQGFEPGVCELFNALPLHHISGLMPVLRARCWGGRLRWLPPPLLRDGAGLLAGAMPDPQRPALISLVPTQLQRLLDQPDGVRWLQRFQLIWVGGAALSPDLAQRCRAHGLPLSPCYGSTETAAMVAALPPQRFLAGEEGCGEALPHAELALEAGSGALRIRASSLALGTLEAGRLEPLPLQDGWWSSGDAARLDGGGLRLLGRLDGAISSGGETVFPEQVRERLLARIRAEALPVAELLLLGEPDPLWGERLVALVRRQPGEGAGRGAPSGGPEAPGPADAGPPSLAGTGRCESGLERQAALLARLEALSRELPASMRPRRWLVCDALQAGAAGKWDRRRWQAWLQGQAAADG